MKWFAGVLLLSNVLWAAWVNGALVSLGWAPESPSQPQRLELQLRPQALQLDPGANVTVSRDDAVN